ARRGEQGADAQHAVTARRDGLLGGGGGYRHRGGGAADKRGGEGERGCRSQQGGTASTWHAATLSRAHATGREARRPARAARIMSIVSSTSASQTRQKPILRPVGIGSCNRKTPVRNCSTGVRYCVRPSATRGRRRAAAANSSSGTAVTTPVAIMSARCTGPRLPNDNPATAPVTT